MSYFCKFAKILTFWYIIDPKVFQSTSDALICMPEGLLCEINQYYDKSLGSIFQEIREKVAMAIFCGFWQTRG